MLNQLAYRDLVLVGHGETFDVGYFCSLSKHLLLEKPEGRIEGLDLVLIDPSAVTSIMVFDSVLHPEHIGKEWTC